MGTNFLARFALKNTNNLVKYWSSTRTGLPIASFKRSLANEAEGGKTDRPPIGSTYRPTDFEKKLLVWTGRYKAVQDVPQFVPQDQMERTRNLMRVYGMVGMIILTFVGCIVMIESGKRAQERGESLQKINVEWHKRMKESEQK